MGQLTIALLGRPDVRWMDRPLVFRTRKALAMLAYLAVEAGPHRRDELAELLWPQSDPEQARAMLRTTLQHLRQALPAEAMPVGLILVERDELSLPRQASVSLDLDTLEQAARALRTTPPEGRAALRPALEAGVALYRGEFMQAYSLNDVPAFDHWVQSQQQTWRERAEAVFEALLTMQFETGDLPLALAHARRWAAADRLSEAAARWQMQLHFAMGQPAEALRVFEAHSAALRQELNVEPEPAVAALAERIRRSERPAPGPAHQAGRATLAAQPVVAPMVGRAGEFSQLIHLAHVFRSGQPQAVLIAGEAGIGKTRLAREFTRNALAEGLDVWEARAFEAVGRVPYQVVVDALRARVERENAPDDLLGDIWLAELSRLLPELRERYPDLPAPLPIGEAEAQARLFEAVARLVVALTERGPVVFFVDDAQWADAASLDLLHYLARHGAERRSRLLLLLTVRSEDRAAAALAGWVATLDRVLPVTWLSLGALTLPHTQQWVQALAGYAGAAPPEPLRLAIQTFSDWLQVETGGQPFFITETVRAMREQGLVGPLGGNPGDAALDVAVAAQVVGNPAAARVALGIPAGVRDIIRVRTQRLGGTAAELLAAAAVIGQAATFDILQAVAALDERDGLLALDELLAARLLQEMEAEGGTRYLITHDKIRHLTYTTASNARRRALHRRAFEALRATGWASAADLAYHALSAGLAHEGARWSLAAGDQAMSVFDVRRMIEHYARAQQALGGALEALDAGAYLRLGRAYELNGESALGQQAYERLLAVARSTRSPALEVSALSRLVTLAIQAFDEPRMNDLLAQMLASAQTADDQQLQAQVEWTLAQSYNYVARMDEAQAHGERGLALATAIGDAELIARCLNVLCYIYNGTFQSQRALAAAEESSRRYADLGNVAMESDSLAQIASAQVRLGQARQSMAAARRSRQRAEAAGNIWGIVNTDLKLAVSLGEAGELGEAHRTAAAAVRLAQERRLGLLGLLGLITLGIVQRNLFQLEDAQRTLAEANSLDVPRAVAMRAAVELCAVCAQQGDWAAAHALLTGVQAERVHPLFFAERCLYLEVEALLRVGEAERAADFVRRYELAVRDSPRGRLDHARALATWLAFTHQPAQAIAHLEQAAQSAAALDLPGQLWQMLAQLGQVHSARAEEAAAQAAFARVRDILRSLATSIPDEAMRQTFWNGANATMAGR